MNKIKNTLSFQLIEILNLLKNLLQILSGTGFAGLSGFKTNYNNTYRNCLSNPVSDIFNIIQAPHNFYSKQKANKALKLLFICFLLFCQMSKSYSFNEPYSKKSIIVKIKTNNAKNSNSILSNF